MKVKIAMIAEKHRLSVKREISLSIRLTQNKKRKYIRIGISLKPEYRDDIKSKVKCECPNFE